MATQASPGGGLDGRDRATVRLVKLSDYRSYWRDEGLLYQFEYDLEKLLYRAGLRGVFEVKQAGRRVVGSKREGITLGQVSDFGIEVQAEYGASSQQDVWRVVFDQKDTASLYERLTRALAGETLPSMLKPPAKPQQLASQTAESGHETLPTAEEQSADTQLPKSLFDRDLLGMAHCLIFLWGSANENNCVEKGVLTSIAMEHYPEFQDKRKTTPIHKSFGQRGFFERLESGNYQLIQAPIENFLSEHREALLQLQSFVGKLKECEELSKGNPKRLLTVEATRMLTRIQELLLKKTE